MQALLSTFLAILCGLLFAIIYSLRRIAAKQSRLEKRLEQRGL